MTVTMFWYLNLLQRKYTFRPDPAPLRENFVTSLKVCNKHGRFLLEFRSVRNDNFTLFNIAFERFYCFALSLTLCLFEKMYQTLQTKQNYIRSLLMQNAITRFPINSVGHFRGLSNTEVKMSFDERSYNILKLLN